MSPVSWNLTCFSQVCRHLGTKGSVAGVQCEKVSPPGCSDGIIHPVPLLLALEPNIRPIMLRAASEPRHVHFLQETSVCFLISSDPFAFSLSKFSLANVHQGDLL